ncbi:MAG TPA: HAMP domain-containing sensor histidine kinase [Myxococcales bacterium]|jgi:two-component system sensor histidine kinase HydH
MSGKLARYGLFASTIAMALALVATGAVGYSAARSASAALVQARAIDVTLLLRRELHMAEVIDAQALQDIVDGLAEQQVTYLAVLDGQGDVLAKGGVPTQGRVGQVSGVGNLRWQKVGERIRAEGNIGRPFRNHHMFGPRTGRSGLSFVVEFLPGPAAALASRALVTLVISCFAAALLLAVAALSFRRARETERLMAQLARDQQLKSLGQMSAVLSHELRNPLTGLKGHTQLLLEKLAPDHPARPGAERILAGAMRLQTTANQILDFSRTGAVTARPESPREVAEAAIELAGEPRVHLQVGPDVTTWPLDRLRMEQVLVNLIRNAAQAAPEGPIEVGVNVARGCLEFTVRDHGPGLPPGEEARIFEPFHGKNVRGTGLGLAICRQIVEAHRGRIEGENQPDGGALFRVRIPEADS